MTPVRPEPASAAETPAPVVERRAERTELVVREDSVIGIRMESSLSSETAQLEDRVTAVVTRDVPDYAIAVGVPARVIGDVRERPTSKEIGDQVNGDSRGV